MLTLTNHQKNVDHKELFCHDEIEAHHCDFGIEQGVDYSVL